VGTEGKLGGQARVEGVSGTWKDLTDSVNFMAGNLTSQVRGIARVVTAVANGDLTRKLTLEAEGEIAALSDTINGMIDTLARFADQVTTVAREVGVEGKLGGQASVPGAAGTWKDLTDNVNQLAANLTTQVRAIAEVATAVTTGDLTRSITVKAQGEVAALKDNINEMIRNLKDTTLKNSEQDWLKTNLAKFSRMLQGQRDLLTVGRLILSELAPVVSAQQAVFYVLENDDTAPQLSLLAGYAHTEHSSFPTKLRLGEGLVGQCAVEKQKILLQNPPASYLKVSSGLGDATPISIAILPVLFEGGVKAVLELASFEHFNPMHHAFLDQLTESIGIVLNTIEANTRTENLLRQSQSLARELQTQQQELQQTNQQLEEKAKLLAERNVEVERKNTEVEQARQALEEKAKQLSLTSKFKSEFLANMSHELRTPLNSLLILSDQLSKNPSGNLLPKQVQFAQTIHAAGNDLLTLINDILDLSKIESGTVVIDIENYSVEELRHYVERTFRHVAEAQRLEFAIEIDPRLPRDVQTDPKRLQQVLKNLLSNAFKFTERGSVILRIGPADSGWSADVDTLAHARSVLAISVTDTGVGIPAEKQKIIFEAFQQADGSTSRKYGGTGLGLAISRELTRLLGGELVLTSSPNRGSTFTLYLPQNFSVPRGRKAPAGAVRAREHEERPVTPSIAAEDGSRRGVDLGHDDDRDAIGPGDLVALIVDNDVGFARFVLDTAREQGFKGIVTSFGAAGVALARERPPSVVILDICLPDLDGWRVLSRLKRDLATRHVPVHIITTEEDRHRGLQLGAVGVLGKPLQDKGALERMFTSLRALVTRPDRSVLLVGYEGAEAAQLRATLAHEGLRVDEVRGWAQARAAMRRQPPDVLVVDPSVPGVRLRHVGDPPDGAAVPVVVYAPDGLSIDRERELSKAGPGAVHVVRTLDRVLDQAMLLLHRAVDRLPDAQQHVLRTLYGEHASLAGRKVLIVDDDVRNIFAMTSVLESHDMTVIASESGREAIARLQHTADVDFVLMDIMMPDMDGYDTMRAIRRIPALQHLPIVAITAKAMKGDREKCIEAGAWDYLAKPVAEEALLGVFRTWLQA
jgi:signal transduction histidine kinase/CheY-like chemotaxis protein/HAMP domain-containing protein